MRRNKSSSSHMYLKIDARQRTRKKLNRKKRKMNIYCEYEVNSVFVYHTLIARIILSKVVKSPNFVAFLLAKNLLISLFFSG